MNFSAMGLSDPILRSITAIGFTAPTEIQVQAIPAAINGQDIIGCAPTGTGKTAAFVLPILHRLLLGKTPQSRVCAPRALVLTPTRELAQQIEEEARRYAKHTAIRAMSIYGGESIVHQLRAMKQRFDIISATPGRLLDHMDRRSIDLSKVEILVLDEADRMYDMGFIRDVRKIISAVPKKRQTLLFSATMSKEIRALVTEIQTTPLIVKIGEPFSPVDTVMQHFFSISQHSKISLLLHILKKETVETMLVFSRTKHGADKITQRLLANGINSAAIHSNRSQSQRQQALEGFKRRKFRVLVATDVAARGIDINRISHVVNYDTPVFAEDYIHRIGRTGRAEEKGTAFTFVSGEEVKYVKKIEYLTRKRFALQGYPGFEGHATFEPPMTFERNQPQGKHDRYRKEPGPHDRSTPPRQRNRFSRNNKPQRRNSYA
jgi:ATP-dependent RNA helicase RhlE